MTPPVTGSYTDLLAGARALRTGLSWQAAGVALVLLALFSDGLVADLAWYAAGASLTLSAVYLYRGLRRIERPRTKHAARG